MTAEEAALIDDHGSDNNTNDHKITSFEDVVPSTQLISLQNNDHSVLI